MEVDEINVYMGKVPPEDETYPKWLEERDIPDRSTVTIRPSSLVYFLTFDFFARVVIIVSAPWLFIESCSDGMHPAGYVWFVSYTTIAYLVEWCAFRPVAKPRKGTRYHYLKWAALSVIDFILVFKMLTQWLTIVLLAKESDQTNYAALVFGIGSVLLKGGYIVYALVRLREKVEYYDVEELFYPVFLTAAKPALAHLLTQADLYKKGIEDIKFHGIRFVAEDLPFLIIGFAALSSLDCSEPLVRGLIVSTFLSMIFSLGCIAKAFHDRMKLFEHSEAVSDCFSNREVVDVSYSIDYHRAVKLMEREILNSTKLKEIQFSNKNASQLQLWILTNALLHNQRLVHVDLSGFERQFSTQLVYKVTYFVKHNDSLTHLDISRNDFDGDDLAKIFSALKDNSILKSLRIGGQRNMGNPGTRALAELFRSNMSLLELDISHNKLNSHQVDFLLVTLAELVSEFEMFDITGNTYEESHISEFIKLNPGILLRAESLDSLASTLRVR